MTDKKLLTLAKKRSRIWIKSSKRFGIISALPKVQFTVHPKQTGLSQEKKEIQNWKDAVLAALKMIDDLPTLQTTTSEENCNLQFLLKSQRCGEKKKSPKGKFIIFI